MINRPPFNYIASAARTATHTGGTIDGENFQAAYIAVKVTAVTATPSVIITAQFAMDKDASVWASAHVFASAAITATGTKIFFIGTPAAVSSAVVDAQTADIPLPSFWRLSFTHGDSDEITYSVDIIPIGGF